MTSSTVKLLIQAGSQIEAGSPIQAGGFISLVSIEAGSLINEVLVEADDDSDTD